MKNPDKLVRALKDLFYESKHCCAVETMCDELVDRYRLTPVEDAAQTLEQDAQQLMQNVQQVITQYLQDVGEHLYEEVVASTQIIGCIVTQSGRVFNITSGINLCLVAPTQLHTKTIDIFFSVTTAASTAGETCENKSDSN